jgi:putative SOS response-associated peptidase YedK
MLVGMCGRYASFREAQDIADAFAATDVADDARLLPPSWNVAPTDPVRIVVERERDSRVRSLQVARWGLVPGWAKDPSVGSRMINARVETLDTKPAFRKALGARRCIVPAEGYYEWQRVERDGKPAKQPFWIHSPDDAPLAFAGLYEFWRVPDRAEDDPLRWLVTMTIVTGDAGLLGSIHDRRPVVLPPDRWDDWLDPTRDATAALELLADEPPPLVPVRVSPTVNSVRNDGPHLIEPVD